MRRPPSTTESDDRDIGEFLASELDSHVRWHLRAEIIRIVAHRHDRGSADRRRLISMAARFEVEALMTERGVATIH